VKTANNSVREEKTGQKSNSRADWSNKIKKVRNSSLPLIFYMESVEACREATTGCASHLSNVKQLRSFVLLQHINTQQ